MEPSLDRRLGRWTRIVRDAWRRPRRRRGTPFGQEQQLGLLEHWVIDYALYMLDAAGRVAVWNEGAQRVSGYAEDEVLGEPFSLFFTPEDRALGRPRLELEEARRRGYFEDVGWRLRKDGSRYWAHVVVVPLYDRERALSGYAKITHDLTQVGGASVEQVRRIADLLPDIVWVTDPEGSVIYFNQAWTQYTGLPKERGLGAGWRKAVHPEDLGKLSRFWARARADGADIDIEHRLRDAEGRYHWYLARGTAIRDGAGRVSAYFGTSIDIDARRRESEDKARLAQALEAAVERRTRELRETIADLESFSYTASHDLRAPLRAIDGYARMLLRDCGPLLDAENHARLEHLCASVERMDRLIYDLLIYTTIAKADFTLEPVPLDPLAAQVVADLDAGAEVALRGSLGTVLGHRSVLREVLGNLIDNARKFVAPGLAPRVVVRAEERAETLRLWVEDNGIGIAPEIVEKIFQPFVRGHAEHYPGTGIGLAIVKKAAMRLGGDAGVVSRPGEGSRFWVDLPRAP